MAQHWANRTPVTICEFTLRTWYTLYPLILKTLRPFFFQKGRNIDMKAQILSAFNRDRVISPRHILAFTNYCESTTVVSGVCYILIFSVHTLIHAHFSPMCTQFFFCDWELFVQCWRQCRSVRKVRLAPKQFVRTFIHPADHKPIMIKKCICDDKCHSYLDHLDNAHLCTVRAVASF